MSEMRKEEMREEEMRESRVDTNTADSNKWVKLYYLFLGVVYASYFAYLFIATKRKLDKQS